MIGLTITVTKAYPCLKSIFWNTPYSNLRLQPVINDGKYRLSGKTYHLSGDRQVERSK